MTLPKRSLVRDALAALLLYALLLEWLHPLLDMAEWSGIYRIDPFVLAFGCFVAAEWLRLPGWLGWPLKLSLCLWLIARLFADGAGGGAWLLDYAGMLADDLLAIASGNLADVHPENRTMLFLVGWAMMIHVLYAAVVERGRSLWFVSATLLYLLGLQLWPGINTSSAVMRTMWFGFLLTALLPYSTLAWRYGLRRMPGWAGRAAVVLPLLVSAALAGGLMLPDAARSAVMEPLSPDYVRDQLLSAWAGEFSGKAEGEEGGRGMTGYGRDDSSLGGPIKQDDSIAFTALTEELAYWRGEAKTVYTGRGWLSAEQANSGGGGDFRATSDRTAEVQSPEARGGGDSRAEPAVGRMIRQEVTLFQPSLAGPLFAAGPIGQIEEMVAQSGRAIPVQAVTTGEGGAYVDVQQSDPLRRYRLLAELVPTEPTPGALLASDRVVPAAEGEGEADDRELGQSTEMLPIVGGTLEGRGEQALTVSAAVSGRSAGPFIPLPGEDNILVSVEENALGPELPLAATESLQAELQLPSTVPVRVGLLAESIAYGLESDWERAKAIETYMRTHYTYTLDPAAPEPNLDFADAFLFESKAGYCDYFSTSMAVLLRSIGIPARWVKGFAPGEETGRGWIGETEAYRVTVRNLHAHSWVEAYIEGAGWVAFDPTPSGHVPGAAVAAAALAPAAAEHDSPETEGKAAGAAVAQLRKALGTLDGWRDRMNDTYLPLYVLTGGIAVILISLLLAAAVRRVRTIRDRAEREEAGVSTQTINRRHYGEIDKVWHSVFRIFRSRGRKRREATVREYVESLQLEPSAKLEALLRFVRAYEDARYSGSGPSRSDKGLLKRLREQLKSLT